MVFCNVFGLAFNIICLSKIDAIMHQVTRGITLPMTALLGPLLGNDSSSWRVLPFASQSFWVRCRSFWRHKINEYLHFRSCSWIDFFVDQRLQCSILFKIDFNGGNKFSAIDLVYYNNFILQFY